MTVDELKENLCKDLIVGAYERQNRKFLVTRFTYPVGDSVNVYLVDEGDHQQITDLGTTHYFLRVANVDMDTDARAEFVQSVCASNGIEMGADFSLRKTITPETASIDVLEFCEAITRISALHYDQKARQFQSFADEASKVISEVVQPERIQRGWTDPTIPGSENYPIDYHLNTFVPARNIFVVGSRLGSESAIGTMNFYLANRRLDPSMTLVAKELTLPRRVERKLEMTSRMIYGADKELIGRFVAAN